MNIMSITYTRWLEILRYFNRIYQLEDHRLPKIVLKYDMDNGMKGWGKDVNDIAEKLHLPTLDTGVLYDLDTAKKSLEILSSSNKIETMVFC